MIKSKRQQDAGNLVDLYTPMSDHDKLVLQKVYGLAPLEPNAIERRPLHESGCMCLECWDAGLKYGEYLHNKRMEQL
jgi:hypothetical protein